MKPFLYVVSLVAVIMSTSAALASHQPGHRTAKIVATPLASAEYLQTPVRRRSANPAYDVYVNGLYAGSDPDSSVRYMLRRDGPWRNR